MEWKIVGIIAAICTTSGFIPQIIKGFRTKRLDDVSPRYVYTLNLWPLIVVVLWHSYRGYDNYRGKCIWSFIQHNYYYFAL